jgi:hypothetical protein
MKVRVRAHHFDPTIVTMIPNKWFVNYSEEKNDDFVEAEWGCLRSIFSSLSNNPVSLQNSPCPVAGAQISGTQISGAQISGAQISGTQKSSDAVVKCAR